MAYISQTDCQNLLSLQVLTEIYDDTNVGTPGADQLGEDILASCSMVDAKLARVYPGPFPIQQAQKAWAASTAYTVGQQVVPTAANGFAYVCTAPGTTGTTQPAWPTTLATTVVDGTCTWMCTTLAPQLVVRAALFYFRALAYQRDPERVRQDGDKWFTMADKFAEDLCEAKAWLTDLVASPQPENVGGIIYDTGPRVTIDGADGSDNLGLF